MGRLDPELGERALRRGMADFISLNRRLLADPELPNKIASGRPEDIAPCTACISCFDFGEHGQPVYCRVNASLGREREYEIKPADPKKGVMVWHAIGDAREPNMIIDAIADGSRIARAI